MDGSQTIIGRLLQVFLRRYAESEGDALAPFLVGSRLLDLGAGEGYVAAALRQRTGIWACAVDVGPYQRTPGPYLIYDGARLPFRDATFATTLISLALHHCVEPEGVLDEAVRVTRSRLIILESVYRNRWERFCLERLDSWLNRYRHNGHMYVPLAFKGPQEWQQLFDMRSPANRREAMARLVVGAVSTSTVAVCTGKGGGSTRQSCIATSFSMRKPSCLDRSVRLRNFGSYGRNTRG